LTEHLKTRRHYRDVEAVLGTKIEAGKEQMKGILERLLKEIKITN
jgi:hypothetical protein